MASNNTAKTEAQKEQEAADKAAAQAQAQNDQGTGDGQATPAEVISPLEGQSTPVVVTLAPQYTPVVVPAELKTSVAQNGTITATTGLGE
jgi:hypothetical protein